MARVVATWTSCFAPNRAVTREQTVTILHRFALKFIDAYGSESALDGFTDAELRKADRADLTGQTDLSEHDTVVTQHLILQT